MWSRLHTKSIQLFLFACDFSNFSVQIISVMIILTLKYNYII